MALNDGVIKNSATNQFEVAGSEGRATLSYRENAERITLVHTEVARELEGRGYGALLARSALDYARANNLRVIPSCPFVSEFIKRHPEYADLVRGSEAS